MTPAGRLSVGSAPAENALPSAVVGVARVERAGQQLSGVYNAAVPILNKAAEVMVEVKLAEQEFQDALGNLVTKMMSSRIGQDAVQQASQALPIPAPPQPLLIAEGLAESVDAGPAIPPAEPPPTAPAAPSAPVTPVAPVAPPPRTGSRTSVQAVPVPGPSRIPGASRGQARAKTSLPYNQTNRPRRGVRREEKGRFWMDVLKDHVDGVRNLNIRSRKYDTIRKISFEWYCSTVAPAATKAPKGGVPVRSSEEASYVAYLQSAFDFDEMKEISFEKRKANAVQIGEAA